MYSLTSLIQPVLCEYISRGCDNNSRHAEDTVLNGDKMKDLQDLHNIMKERKYNGWAI